MPCAGGDRMTDECKPLVSLIFPAKNEGGNVRSTLESALQAKTDYSFEMIIVDDGSTDGCCDVVASYSHANMGRIRSLRTEGIGLAQAKNLGARHSKGEYLIFCDAHLFFEDLWIDGLLEPIRTGLADGTTPGIAPTNSPDIVGYGQTLDNNLGIQWNGWQANPFPSAVMPGGCFAVSRHVFFDIGGFDHGFRLWGYEDVEISLKMWLFGYKCYVQPNVKILHLFRETHPYTVTYDHINYNLMRMAYSHFNVARILQCNELIKYSDPDHIESTVLESNVLRQRQAYFARRKYDDNWYMHNFGIPF